IAGATLAYWLRRSGHEVLLVEEAPHLRTGGYIVDFWGIGYDVAERMGLIARIRELGYQVKEVRFVDDQGRKRGGFATEAIVAQNAGRFTSVLRSDLAATVYEALDADVETIFADSITAVDEHDGHVTIGFAHASPRDVDLVVGADGLHSRIRALAFGSDSTFAAPLGFHVAAFEVRGYRPRDELVYVVHGKPGRQISRFAMRDDTTLFLFVFRDEYLGSHAVVTEQDRKAAIAETFSDVDWECPRILSAMEAVDDVYFDGVTQIRMDRWTKGRIALIGDAAACVSLLAGEGSGLAMAEAYVLAGELRQCGDNYSPAFALRTAPDALSRTQAACRGEVRVVVLTRDAGRPRVSQSRHRPVAISHVRRSLSRSQCARRYRDAQLLGRAGLKR